jgi:hypothetical protein
VIPEYVDAVGRALSFDRALARRVRQEVEDHLREAAAASLAGNRRDAERQATAAFGDPHVIAGQIAIVALARQSRRVGAIVILAIAGIFTTMKARVAWYAHMQWNATEDVGTIGSTVHTVDRYAFWLSVVLGVAAFAHVSARAVPTSFRPGDRTHLRRFCFLCAAAAFALSTSVASDGVLTATRLLEAGFCPTSLIPAGTVAVEVACAGILISHIRGMVRRATSTANLLNR